LEIRTGRHLLQLALIGAHQASLGDHKHAHPAKYTSIISGIMRPAPQQPIPRMTSNTGQRHKSSIASAQRVPTWAVLLLIIAAGGVLRFYRVETVPPGLYQ